MAIFTEISGKGENIVILHGLCSTHIELQPVVDKLNKHYHVTAADSPGIGTSSWETSTNSVHDMADQLLSALPLKAIYIGGSFGGQLSISIAARYPERVKQVICIGSSPKFIAEKDWIGMPEKIMDILGVSVREKGVEPTVWGFYENEFAKINPKPALYQWLKQSFPNRGAVPLDTVLKTTMICDATDLRQELSKITCPVDFIMGTEDAAVPVEAYPAIQALNPRHVRVHPIPGALHLPYLTHPAEFNALLDKLL